MNIQISVIIWTVICFFLLVVILKNLLFKPVLAILDERKRKLTSAREKKAENERIAAEQIHRLEERREAFKAEAEAKIRAELAETQETEKKQLKEAHKQSLEDIKTYSEQMEKDHERILATVTPKMEKVAEIFAQKIISDRK